MANPTLTRKAPRELLASEILADSANQTKW